MASCDLVVAGEEARFATPGVHIGLFCSTPMVALSRAVSRKHAMEMLLLGETVRADDALRIGLVNRVVPAGQAFEQAMQWARVIASKSQRALRIGKKAFYEQAEMPIADAYRHAGAVMVENMLSFDAEEGIGAFIHHAFAGMHIGNGDCLLNGVEHQFTAFEKIGNDAGDIATMFKRRAGDPAHQSDIGTTIDKGDFVFGQRAPKIGGGLHEGRIISRP